MHVKPNIINIIYNFVNEVLCWFHDNQHPGFLQHCLALAALGWELQLGFSYVQRITQGRFFRCIVAGREFLTMLNILGEKGAHTFICLFGEGIAKEGLSHQNRGMGSCIDYQCRGFVMRLSDWTHNRPRC